MTDLRHDASTTIETQIRKFIRELERLCGELHVESLQRKRAEVAAGTRASKVKPFPKDIRIVVSKNARSLARTPAEQAAAVVRGGSWVCWGGHMSDKARHIILRIDGKPYYGLGKWKTSKANKADFKAAFSKAMKKADLRNFKGTRGFQSGDEFHLELPDSRVRRKSARAQACLEEYVRLTRKVGKPQNTRFEDKYGKLIEKAAKRRR